MGRGNHQYLPLTEGLMKDLVETGGDEPTPSDLYRIRDRVHHTIVNGDHLFWHLGSDQQGKIFDMSAAGTSESAVKTKVDAKTGEQVLKDDYQEFHAGVKGWLAFLYAGVSDAGNVFDHTNPRYDWGRDGKPERQLPNARFDFEEMLEQAVRDVARQRGEKITRFELTIESEPAEPHQSGFDTEELKTRLESDHPELSLAELNHLREEGVIESVDKYLDEYVNRRPPTHGKSELDETDDISE